MTALFKKHLEQLYYMRKIFNPILIVAIFTFLLQGIGLADLYFLRPLSFGEKIIPVNIDIITAEKEIAIWREMSSLDSLPPTHYISMVINAITPKVARVKKRLAMLKELQNIDAPKYMLVHQKEMVSSATADLNKTTRIAERIRQNMKHPTITDFIGALRKIEGGTVEMSSIQKRAVEAIADFDRIHKEYRLNMNTSNVLFFARSSEALVDLFGHDLLEVSIRGYRISIRDDDTSSFIVLINSAPDEFCLIYEKDVNLLGLLSTILHEHIHERFSSSSRSSLITRILDEAMTEKLTLEILYYVIHEHLEFLEEIDYGGRFGPLAKKIGEEKARDIVCRDIIETKRASEGRSSYYDERQFLQRIYDISTDQELERRIISYLETGDLVYLQDFFGISNWDRVVEFSRHCHKERIVVMSDIGGGGIKLRLMLYIIQLALANAMKKDAAVENKLNAHEIIYREACKKIDTIKGKPRLSFQIESAAIKLCDKISTAIDQGEVPSNIENIFKRYIAEEIQRKRTQNNHLPRADDNKATLSQI